VTGGQVARGDLSEAAQGRYAPVVPSRSRAPLGSAMVPAWQPKDCIHGGSQRSTTGAVPRDLRECTRTDHHGPPSSRPGRVGVRGLRRLILGDRKGTRAPRSGSRRTRGSRSGEGAGCAASWSRSEGGAAVRQDHLLMCSSGLSHDEASRRAPTGIVGQLLVFKEVLVWRRLPTVSAFVTTAWLNR
jgi:hypothetical protein